MKCLIEFLSIHWKYGVFTACVLLPTVFLYSQSDSIPLGLQRSSARLSDYTVDCAAEFSITKFKLTNSGSAPKLKNKVVIGREIDYQAKPRLDPPYEWTVRIDQAVDNGDSVVQYLPFVAVTPIAFADKGSGLLHLDSLFADSLMWNNNQFGPATAEVFAGNPIDSAEEQVEIFFEKDSMNIYDPAVPNWFYHWSQIPEVQGLLNIPGIKLFDSETCSFSSNPVPHTLTLEYDPALPYSTTPGAPVTYGQNSFAASGLTTTNPSLFCDSIASNAVGIEYAEFTSRITLGPGCGQQKPIPNSATGQLHRGIQVFHSTLIHEVEHALIECEVWTDGYDRSLDSDNDGYNDNWEMNQPATATYHFIVGVDDSYAQGYDSSRLGQTPPVYSAGTEYEEARCRNKELDLFNNHTIDDLDALDWSFDPSNSNQGKNWKN